eukprot:TRINITY_DN94452_c0_g1_i1.p1 TRINITY_DN94452_c0_g1~~TRINITY_DN94452_c0_g1_i1.p1  ORF type:complete len:273 (+),score=41.70 TRINITY_DN94452_c0_g1_i1:112-930(+)
MAAVVASLVAFAAGIPLVYPAGTIRAGTEHERGDLGAGVSDSAEDPHGLQVWHTAAGPELSRGSGSGEVKGGGSNEGSVEAKHRRSINGRLAQLANGIAFIKAAGVQSLLSWESSWGTPAVKVDDQGGSADVACWESPEIAETVVTLDVPDQASRAVRFDLELNTEHEITPYSEVYGLHPRDFHFTKGPALSEDLLDPTVYPYTIVPVLKHKPRVEDSDDDDEGPLGLQSRGLRFLGVSRRLPWTCWLLGGWLILMMRLVGSDLCAELLDRM